MRHVYDGCPLCGGRHEPIGQAQCTHHRRWVEGLPPVIEWQQCVDCGHVFTSGHFTDEALALLFSGTNDEQQPGGVDVEKRRDRWSTGIERIANCKPSGSWLDVGCGDGAAMFVADEFGFDVVGIDLRQSTVDALGDIGYRVACVPLSGCGGAFDIVSMFDVLEHMPFPADELRHVHGLLNLGGIVAISTPNMDSQSWRALDDIGTNPYWGEIEHYHNFTRRRLADLLVECGFVVESFALSDRFRLGMEMIARKAE